MHLIDWIVLVVPVLLSITVALAMQRYLRGVADFLAAGRCAGRYLVANAEGTAAMGAITILAIFEMTYRVGITVSWWQSINTPVWLLVALSGFVIYRYRETRAMTMAQFFEMRYSRRFRIFMGMLAWVAGLVNFGIFPVVGANFFVYYLDLPRTIIFEGWALPTYVAVMALLLTINCIIVTTGGQLTALVTDCVEGLIGGVFFIALMIGVLWVFDWRQMSAAMLDRPSGHSLLNPFDAGEHADFNIWFVLIGLFGGVYSYMAWQGNSGFNASAASPHEAKMGRILGQWRGYARGVAIGLLAMGAITFMHDPAQSDGAARVHAELASLGGTTPASQAVVPLALREFLPIGVKGMFAAVMLFAIMACDASYMHSWGSIFVQDVLLPIRQARGRPPLSPSQHLRWLRVSIAAVALFAFAFGIVYRQSDYLLMFFAITGAIYLGGAGSCIIGGLYWSRGTTAAAWSAMICGATLAVAGLVIQQVVPDFPLNGAWLSFITMVAAICLYVTVSVISNQRHDMDRLLHRGRYAVDPLTGQPIPEVERPPRSWKSLLGIDANFSRGDKVQSVLLFSWSMFWFVLFLVITLWNLFAPWPDAWWSGYVFWTGILLPLPISIITAIWFTWGGLRDLRLLFARLRAIRVSPQDNGVVASQEAARVHEAARPLHGQLTEAR